MPLRSVGSRSVSAVGLGAMPMSVRAVNDPDAAFATIKAALEAGVTLIDTADAYSIGEHDFGANESLIASALRRLGTGRHDVVVATKGGHTRSGKEWTIDGSPDHLHSACRASLRRLGVERIDLYQHHRPDPSVPYTDSIGAMKELYDDGLIAAVGISNADPTQIRTAHSILGSALVSVQNQFSPDFLTSRPEIELASQLGLAFLAWSPLGGMQNAAALGAKHSGFAEVAQRVDVSVQQVALAWELSLSDCVIVIPGASKPGSICDSAAAGRLELSAEDLEILNSVAFL